MHKSKVCSKLFITKLHLVCRHLAATVEKLAHADREVGILLCCPEVTSQGEDLHIVQTACGNKAVFAILCAISRHGITPFASILRNTKAFEKMVKPSSVRL